mgnify:CR=1 FL=1
MGKTWGVARFYGMGSMEYLLESGNWLADRNLFDGAPVLLFDSMAEADSRAAILARQSGDPHGVQFTVDAQGKVLTARRERHMKAEFVIFEDTPGYWFVPYAIESDARATPERHRGTVYSTKIAACRAALAQAVAQGASELHLHGFGATTTIKKESSAKGLKSFVYWPSITTKIAPYQKAKR